MCMWAPRQNPLTIEEDRFLSKSNSPAMSAREPVEPMRKCGSRKRTRWSRSRRGWMRGGIFPRGRGGCRGWRCARGVGLRE